MFGGKTQAGAGRGDVGMWMGHIPPGSGFPTLVGNSRVKVGTRQDWELALWEALSIQARPFGL